MVNKNNKGEHCEVAVAPYAGPRPVAGGPQERSSARKIKIVCTIGPSSSDRQTLRRMAEAGMDVARINTGHIEPGDVSGYLETLEAVEAQTGKRIGVMLDLQGPRLRVGVIKGSSVELATGGKVIITSDQQPGDSKRIPVSYEGLHRDLKVGDSVLMDDGLIRLVVQGIDRRDIMCDILEGGTLLEGKGMNFPGASLKLPSVTERDRHFLKCCLGPGIDWVAQSFVRDSADVKNLREAVDALGHETPIMAKIEKGEAVANILGILGVADGVMVARGDLGVELNTEEVPFVQKGLIESAQLAARPVLTATQMLESMVWHSRPTRAEATDVANAILDGTDAVMLSGETAVGQFPVKTVETMRRIADRAERAIDYRELLQDRGRWAHGSSAEAMGFAACQVASDLEAGAIVTVTRTGYTARLIARYRPEAQIIAVSSHESVVDEMSLVWGVTGIVVPYGAGILETVKRVVEECRKAGLVSRGELVVVTGGFLDEQAGTTNTINVRLVE